MEAFTLAAYHWERASLWLELDPSTPLPEDASLALKGIRFDPAGTNPPMDREFRMTGCYREGPHAFRVRFLLGEGGNPVRVGTYQLLVRTGESDAPVRADTQTVHPRPTTNKLDDVLLNARVSSYYKVVPLVRDDTLWFAVEARNMPDKFGYQAKKALKNGRDAFKRGFLNYASVRTFEHFKKTHKRKAGKKAKILFTSDSRTALSGNMEPLYQRMRERGIDDSCEVVFSFSDNQHGRRSAKGYLQLAYHLATSKVIFCDDFQPFLYHVRYPDDTRLVQLWHACGHFKTVGVGRIGTLDANPPFSNDHRTYTDMIVASESDVPIYGEAFNIPDECVKPYGIPRHDWLLDANWRQGKREAFKEAFPKAAGKRIVMFAPTFRGAGKLSAHYDYTHIDFEGLAAFCRERGLYFIFKMHPFISQLPKLPAGSDDVFADGSAIREINDLLPSTDVLVTDYSSVVYEAALLDIPTVYFAYDLDEYISERDFYEPFEEFVSGPIVRDFDTLLQTIADPGDTHTTLEAFRRKNFKYLDGKACDRIIDNIVLPSL